jgi:hypothetical protein
MQARAELELFRVAAWLLLLEFVRRNTNLVSPVGVHACLCLSPAIMSAHHIVNLRYKTKSQLSIRRQWQFRIRNIAILIEVFISFILLVAFSSLFMSSSLPH